MVITDLGVFTIDKMGGGGMTLIELAEALRSTRSGQDRSRTTTLQTHFNAGQRRRNARKSGRDCINARPRKRHRAIAMVSSSRMQACTFDIPRRGRQTGQRNSRKTGRDHGRWHQTPRTCSRDLGSGRDRRFADLAISDAGRCGARSGESGNPRRHGIKSGAARRCRGVAVSHRHGAHSRTSASATIERERRRSPPSRWSHACAFSPFSRVGSRSPTFRWCARPSPSSSVPTVARTGQVTSRRWRETSSPGPGRDGNVLGNPDRGRHGGSCATRQTRSSRRSRTSNLRWPGPRSRRASPPLGASPGTMKRSTPPSA